jgi:branched-chain amino acid aminotransferase
VHDTVVIDDQVAKLGELKLQDFMQGFSFGCGVFETVSVRAAEPVFLNRHLRRLRNSLATLADCVQGCDPGLLRAESVLRAMGLAVREDARIASLPVMKIVVADGHRLVVFREAPANLEERQRGLAIDVVDRATYRAGDPLKNHKTLAYLANYRAMQRHVLFANERDEVCESGSANVFFESAGEIVTPPLDAPCLPGVVREVLLAAGALEGQRVVARPARIAELAEANAVVLTSALVVAPVTRFQGRELSGSQRLAARIRECLARAPDVDC